MAVFAAILIAPWLLALVLTPATIRFAKRHDLMDHPTERKAHRAPVALLGGVAVYAAIVLGVGVLMVFLPGLREMAFGRESLGALALGCGLMLALGLYDDLYDMPALHKLAGQVAIAALTFAMGFQVGRGRAPVRLRPLRGRCRSRSLVTVLWIVVVANAFNFIDGMDGLASGVALITVLTVFLLANQNGATVPVVAALALSGALAGFLRFNLPPARIFLGDAGALSIGYLTAVLSLASYQKSPAAVALIVPLLVLGLPLLDTILAVDPARPPAPVASAAREGLSVRELIGAVTRGGPRTPAPPAAAQRTVGRRVARRPVRGLHRAGDDRLRHARARARAPLRPVRDPAHGRASRRCARWSAARRGARPTRRARPRAPRSCSAEHRAAG